MAENVEATVELKQKHLDYLDAMVEKYALPDRSKALRVLITFAMQDADEKLIYQQIRCADC